MQEYFVEELKERDYLNYNDYLKKNSQSHYGHSLEIKNLIIKYFKFKPRYLVAKRIDNHSIVGILPLFEARSFIEGNRLISIPFFPFGGVLGENHFCVELLLKKAQALINENPSFKYLQIRQRVEITGEISNSFVLQKPITNFFLDLQGTEEQMFNSFDKRVRYDIRKARKANLVVKILNDEKILKDFYKVYLLTRKKRGLPAWPYRLFLDALNQCDTNVAVTYFKDKPIAGCFLFLDKQTVEYAFAGTDYNYNNLSPYYLLLWNIICYGLKNNYKVLELGGSTEQMNDGGMYLFKRRLSTRTEIVPYYFYASDVKNIPQLTKSFNVYKLYGFIWSKLPKTIIKKISPFVMRQFS
ncbi:MAG: GNAT family N-acetyltransferase [archaeon]|nr:GNAT family N-acetyltransferase [archaeon]